MPENIIIPNYLDPVYTVLKNDFAQKSDAYPVALLPVRLETRFMNETRYISVRVPGQSEMDSFVDLSLKLVKDMTIWSGKISSYKVSKSESLLVGYIKRINTILQKALSIQEVDGDDKRVLRDTTDDIQAVLKNIVVDSSLVQKLEELKSLADDVYAHIDQLGGRSISVYQKGYDYLASLQIVQNAILKIYVDQTVNSDTVDACLDEIESHLNHIYNLIDEPDFKATSHTIGAVSSKISYIKRTQKNAFVRLGDFKRGYSGNRDLSGYEYKLRGEINALKVKIDEEHVPYMRLVEEMKSYPIRRLIYRVSKAANFLSAHNQLGYGSYQVLMQIKKDLYKQLRSIRERAHRPLSGNYADINLLKNKYAGLEAEIKIFIAKSTKFKPKDSYQKGALTRLETHLTEEYLADLKDLMPEVKTIEEQTFSNGKMKTTSASSQKTKKLLVAMRDEVKRIEKTESTGLTELNTKLIALKAQISVSTTNTILLPQTRFRELKNILNSLKAHISNFIKANNIHSANKLLVQNNALVKEVEGLVNDQHTDIIDQRDLFYDAYRKKIVFIIQTETVKELWVRIYPDDIAVDNHDERLTDEEEKIGQDYYYEVYGHLEEFREAAKLPAWRAAASSLGVRRAAYIIKVLEPTEVKRNTVRAYESSLKLLVETFQVQLNQPFGKAAVVYLHQSTTFSALVSGVLESVKKALAGPLTICLQNKNWAEKLREIFSKLITRLNNELYGNNNSDTIEIVKGQISQLKLASNAFKPFYEENIVALNEPFRPELNFPIVEKKSKSWDRAGITVVMPDRFVVATKRDQVFQHVVTGNQIPKPLQLSIDPSGNQADRFSHLPNGDLEVPEEIRWLFDFDAAVDVGMAVRVPITDDDFIHGFEFVMAYGVQNDTAEKGQETLDNLFKNHLYSDGGLEFLPVGTATNNAEGIKSPYKGIDEDVDGAFEFFINAEKPSYLSKTDDTELEITDGQFFKDALGLPDEVADFIRNNNKKDIVNGRAMNRALYNATIKYYVNIMVDDLLNANDKRRTVEFMMRNLSAVGTVPSFRIDNQPYGVLPITNYKSYLADGNTQKGTESSFIKTLTMFLRQTRLAFDQFSKKPKSVNSPSYDNDPQAEFLKILGLEPFSKEFYYRYGANVSGRIDVGQEIDFPLNWDGAQGEFIPEKVAALYTTLLKDLGYHNDATRKYAIEKTRAYTNRYFEANFIKGDLVQNHQLGTEKLADVSAGPGFSGNYIDWLGDKTKHASLNPLVVEDIPDVDGEIQNTLLFMMMRGGLLYDSSDFAMRTYPILSKLDVPTLERLLANHIDLCSYRLDAWMEGLSNYRLNKQRSTNKTGTYIGAYGFVADLKQASTKARVQNLPDGLTPQNGNEVFSMPDNQGFIHGPSMNHAVAAAVLRAGYNSLKNRGNNNNALAINLSSARVRKALSLLEGVGNGQESGALLGYMFERALHEKYTDGNGNPLEMDTYIYRLRKKFPTFGDLPKDNDINLEENDSIRASNVVDGLAMIDHFNSFYNEDDEGTFVEKMIDDSGNTASFIGYPWGISTQIPSPQNPPQNSTAALERLKLRAIIHELDNMADAFDALSDLLNAEGVYQLVRGNHIRASAVLNALAEGRIPQDPEIINSMRRGVMVTHRVSLNIQIPQSNQLPWPNIALSPRAKIEHPLNCWLAQQIGNADQVDWKVTFGHTETYLSLEDLGLQPVDLVMLVATGGDESMVEIEMRCVDYLLANGATEDEEIKLQFNEHSPAVNYSFGEIISLLQHLGKVITTARTADARDFRISEDEENFGSLSAGINTVKLLSRITAAIEDYQIVLNSLSPFTADKIGYSEAEADLAREKLKVLTLWGFAGLYPSRDASKDVMSMAARIISAKNRMEQNIAFAQSTLANLSVEMDQGVWLSSTAEIVTKLYGNGFKLLPEFTTTNGLDLRNQLDLPLAEGLLRGKPEGTMNDWLGNSSLVRNRLAAMETVSLLTEIKHGYGASIRPAQLPFDDTLPIAARDYWLGIDYPETFVPDGDRLSLVCFGHENVGENMCALLLDEWMEIIPEEKETTGIAFHYNQPDARAPQTVLLAVTPQITGGWNLDEIALTIEEAYNMSKLRAVEPEHIDYSLFSQLLPATGALSYGFDEMRRRKIEDEGFEDDDQILGKYIDYSAVNHGYEPDQNEE